MKHLRFALGAIVLACVTAACASGGGAAKKPDSKGKSLYARVGGMPAIKALVDGALDRILKDPRVKDYFKGFDTEPIEKHFVQLACVVTGGPCKYEGRSMKATHEEMHVTNAAFDAVMEHILFTMKSLKVKGQEQNEIMAAFNATRKDIVEIK
jgi:hemoglobin